ncbi:uncharacterized protein LOC131167464 [Malania oleifera]|uniref:uncharacterized protein LOC131167464 n=1 Tax=Malania oleifera TaxID=397392 RepID=UPI0025ADDF00|nr:uncharacterized protein LOC131167464 [Malania oleifera]
MLLLQSCPSSTCTVTKFPRLNFDVLLNLPFYPSFFRCPFFVASRYRLQLFSVASLSVNALSHGGTLGSQFALCADAKGLRFCQNAGVLLMNSTFEFQGSTRTVRFPRNLISISFSFLAAAISGFSKLSSSMFNWMQVSWGEVYEVMDWDLWGPPCSQETSYSMINGWQWGFYYDHGLDVIEENALNEKACAQVLRILITKANTEIGELEEELILLQNQMAWAEYEEWPDICCTRLREKINCLAISLQVLKDESAQNENGAGYCLHVCREPAETLLEILRDLLRIWSQEKDKHDLLKSLLRIWCQDKDKQICCNDDSAASNVKDSTSNLTGQATDIMNEKGNLSNLDAEIIRKEKVIECSLNSIGKCTVRSLPQEKREHYLELAKPASNTPVEDSSNRSDEKKLFEGSDEKNIGEEAKEHGSAPADKSIIQNPSLKTEEKTKNVEVVQAADTSVKISSLASENVTDQLTEKVKLSNSALKIVREVVEVSFIPTDSSSSKPEEGTELDNQVQGENTVGKDSSSDALRHAPCSSNEKNNSKLGIEVIEKGKFKKQGSDSTNNSKISKPPLKAGGKRKNCLQNKIANSVVGDSSSDASRCATGSNVKKDVSKLNLEGIKEEEIREHCFTPVDKSSIPESSLQPTEGAISAKNLKSANIVYKDSRSNDLSGPTNESDIKLEPSNGQKDAQGNKTNSLISSLKSEKDLIQILRIHEASLVDAEGSALNSLLKLQEHGGKDTTKQQPKEIWDTKTASNEKKTSSNLPHEPQRHCVKDKIQSDRAGVQDPGLSPMESDLKLSAFLVSRRKQKNQVHNDKANLNQPMCGEITKKVVRLGCCSAPDTATRTVSGLRKKRKTSDLQCMEMKDSNVPNELNGDKTDPASKKKDIQITELCPSGDSLGPLPTSMLAKLHSMKLHNLRSMAKQLKLKKYHKLPKSQLAGLICVHMVKDLC